MTVLCARQAPLFSAIVSFAAVIAAPALAQRSDNAVDLWRPSSSWPPADSGKPAIVTPPMPTLSPNSAGTCLPGMPCGIRLLGTVQRNGAVELQVRAWRW
jgi:hypothetical protein